MQRKTPLLFITVMLFGLLLAACGGDSDTSEPESSAAAASFEVTMNDIYYGDSPDNADNPPVWNATAGARAQLTANNAGALEHNWAIVKKDATLPESFANLAEVEDMILYDIGNVAGGETTTARFDIPAEAGDYTIICTVAGHYPAMQGRLVVEG